MWSSAARGRRIHNNVNGIDGDANGDGVGKEVHRSPTSQVLNVQEAYVRKVLDTLHDLDNVLYEVVNEAIPESVPWQYHFIRFIKQYERDRQYAAHPVGMTFFQLGDMINSKEGPARVLATAASGMQIGSHTWRHKAMATEKVAVVTDQVSKNASALAAITGDQTIFMRPPYGSHNKASDAVAHDAGEVVALWSVDTLDWKTRNTQATIASASASKSGDVVLMHDIHDPTVAAVKQTIANLQSAGFTLVTMAELASPGDWTAGNTYCAAPARKMSCGSAQYTP